MKENTIKTILEYGIALHEQGIHNWALKKEQALEAIKEIKEKKMIILGGDVLEKNKDAFDHNYDNWYYDPNVNISIEENSKQSINKTIDYLENYKTLDNTYFILVVS